MRIIKKERFGYPSTEGGYNLIEICIAMLVVGILLAAGAAAYSNYKKNQVSTITTANVASMAEAINSYRALYGAYPCPAPLDQPRQGPNYGKPDCTTTPAPGNCSNGICIQSSTDATKGNIRIGAIPFRVLNIDDADTYDAYGARLYYAVTDSLTNRTTYSETGGGIDIVDNAGASIVTPPASARYLVFSTGLDQAGGYSREGVLIRACNTANKDGENCNLTQANAVFRSTMLTTAGTTQYFDDIIQPYIKSDPPLWKTTDINPNDIEDLSKDNIGIKALDPTNDLEVEGNIITRPDVTIGASGNMLAAKLCPPGAANCFEPRNIGGDADTGTPGNGANGPGPVAGDGMACPNPYEAMKGIQYGGPECAPVLVSECPSPQIARGIDASGKLICTLPGISCPAAQKTVCSPNDVSLPLSPSGTSIGTITGYPGATTGTPTVGLNRAYRFTCNNGVWNDDLGHAPNGNYYTAHDNPNAGGVPYAWVGDCSCTPSVTTNSSNSCAWYNSGYTGTFTTTTTTTCTPLKTVTVTSGYASDCTCVGTSWISHQACAAPFTGPGYDTPVSQSCIANVLQPAVLGTKTGSCSCADIVRTEACPANFVGPGRTYRKTANPMTCAYGPEELDLPDPCTCATDTLMTHPLREDCPSCSVGNRDRLMGRGGANCEFIVPISDTPNACTPDKEWRTTSTLLYSGPFASVPKAGDTCACNTPPSNCKVRTGGVDYVYACTCEPKL